jgi:hypothetical protein
MGARMPQALQIGHPIPFIQRFSFNRLFGGFSHKIKCPMSKLNNQGLRETKTPRMMDRGVGRPQFRCER